MESCIYSHYQLQNLSLSESETCKNKRKFERRSTI